MKFFILDTEGQVSTDFENTLPFDLPDLHPGESICVRFAVCTHDHFGSGFYHFPSTRENEVIALVTCDDYNGSENFRYVYTVNIRSKTLGKLLTTLGLVLDKLGFKMLFS